MTSAGETTRTLRWLSASWKQCHPLSRSSTRTSASSQVLFSTLLMSRSKCNQGCIAFHLRLGKFSRRKPSRPSPMNNWKYCLGGGFEATRSSFLFLFAFPPHSLRFSAYCGSNLSLMYSLRNPTRSRCPLTSSGFLFGALSVFAYPDAAPLISTCMYFTHYTASRKVRLKSSRPSTSMST
jgi:hypothetical protein